MKEDKILYKEFLDGNKKSFEEIILRYKSNLIFFITRYVKNIETAEDIFQDIALYILENKDYYNFDYSFKTYIYMIAKSKTIDFIKKQKNIDSIDDSNFEIEDAKLLEEIILTKDRQKKIQSVMKKMLPEYQLVIYLTQIEGVSYKDTALIMNKKESQIKTLSFNARKKLRQLMIDERIVEVKEKKIITLIASFLVVGVALTGIGYASYKIITSILQPMETFTEEDFEVNEKQISEAITENEAINISINIAETLGIKEFDKDNIIINLINNPRYNETNWNIVFDNNINIVIDSVSGNLRSFQDDSITYEENSKIMSEEFSKTVGEEFYKKLKSILKDHDEYIFQSIERNHDSSNIWKIEYKKQYDNLIDNNQGVRILVDSEKQKIKAVYVFYANYANNSIEVDEESAKEIAKNYADKNGIKINKNINVELGIELITLFSDDSERVLNKDEYAKINNYTRKVWRILFGANKICVDCTTGEVINVSIVEE